jgi:Fe-S-cluster containining protein
MKIETNPDKIKKLSLAKEGENWGFRSFLKSCEIPVRRIDESVRKFYKLVTKKIDCTKCHNCCTENKTVLTRDDVIRISKKLNFSVKDFEKEYLVNTETGEGFIFNRKPCPFLKANTCSIYTFRPRYCVLYPHICQDGFVKRLISVIHNCSICPIVFNIFELLKEDIWGMDDSELNAENIDE